MKIPRILQSINSIEKLMSIQTSMKINNMFNCKTKNNRYQKQNGAYKN